MLYNLWRFIQLWLPFWLVLRIYRYNKALPTNIKTRQGNNLKAIMVTKNYGLLFTEDEYIQNRSKVLLQLQRQLDQQSNDITRELNSLSFMEREALMAEEQTNGEL